MADSYIVSRKFTGLSEEKMLTGEPVAIQAVNSAGSLEIYISLEESPLSELSDNIRKPELIFADNNPDDDTITRNKGSWIADGFRVGHEIAVANSSSNDGTYTVAGVTDLVLTLDSGDTLTDETLAEGSTVTIDGSIPDADWMLLQTVDNTSELVQIEFGLRAIRLVNASGTSNAIVRS